ncbi:hypothetical protein TNCV_2590601 [Trichonephila clavipes]|nr:hypothetical protein TNCV_2590601 [Trichonephila clavipes]
MEYEKKTHAFLNVKPIFLLCLRLHPGGRGSLVVKALDRGWRVMSSSRVPIKTCSAGQSSTLNLSRAQTSSHCCGVVVWTATARSDVVQSGRPIFDEFFQHLWPYIGNNTANVVFQMVKRSGLIRIDQ